MALIVTVTERKLDDDDNVLMESITEHEFEDMEDACHGVNSILVKELEGLGGVSMVNRIVFGHKVLTKYTVHKLMTRVEGTLTYCVDLGEEDE